MQFSMLLSSVFIVSSAFSGLSYGEDTPVKSLISPVLAFLYNPLTSLDSHTSNGASTNISMK